MKKVYIVGTCDTKLLELTYARDVVERSGARAVLVDISTGQNPPAGDVAPGDVAAHHPNGADHVFGGGDRGVTLAAMGEALGRYLGSRSDLGAVLGLGGSGNTSAVTAAMRTLPVGMPKLMVSTMASGDTAPYVGPTDITMMYSVVDIAGLNDISRRVIANASRAVAGMAVDHPPEEAGAKPGLGLTMFGVTTPCITQIRAALDGDYECYVFHATGTGGQSMEKLAESGFMTALMDVTTTEVADMLVGGVLACTEDRFGAVIRTGLPYVGSVGALDMVNFGPRDAVPARFHGRNLYVHNSSVTLMRTTADENRAIGNWLVERLNRMPGPVRFLLPLGGVSALDVPGQPFHDPDADSALFEAVRKGWLPAAGHELIEVEADVNDPAFAQAAVAALRSAVPI